MTKISSNLIMHLIVFNTLFISLIALAGWLMFYLNNDFIAAIIGALLTTFIFIVISGQRQTLRLKISNDDPSMLWYLGFYSPKFNSEYFLFPGDIVKNITMLFLYFVIATMYGLYFLFIKLHLDIGLVLYLVCLAGSYFPVKVYNLSCYNHF